MDWNYHRMVNGIPCPTPEEFERAYRKYLGPVEYPKRKVDSDEASRAAMEEGKEEEGN